MTALLGSFPADQHSNVFCFSVTAAAESSVLPRLMAVFAQLGLVPDKCYATRSGHKGEDLVVDIQMARLDQAQADHLANTMRKIIMVTNVLLYEMPREDRLRDAG